MRQARFTAVLLFPILLTLFSCSPSRPEVEGGLPDYDPQLARKLVEEEGALLLDVRTQREFIQNRLPRAKNIPVKELSGRIQEVEALLAGNKERPIVVYCTVGARAARAKKILLDFGFSKVTNLGGLSDWSR